MTLSDNSLSHVIYFPANELNISYFALSPSPFTLQEWGDALLSPPRATSQIRKATKPNEDRVPHTPAKTEAVPKLRCCYVTSKDLISSCTLLPGCPSCYHNNEPHDGREVVCRDIHTTPRAQEIYAILKYLGLVI